MSKITTFRFPLDNGTEFEIDFTMQPLTMSYKTPNSGERNHTITIPLEIKVDGDGGTNSDPIGTLTIDPALPVPPNAVSIGSVSKIKIDRNGIQIDGTPKGNTATLKG